MDPAETAKVRSLLHECAAEVFLAPCCADARRVLDRGVPIRAIFSAHRLPDGGFHDLIHMACERANPVPVVVFLPDIDGGWIDLLEAGAFDLVVEPYRRDKIERVLTAIPSLQTGGARIRYQREPRKFGRRLGTQQEAE